MGEFQIQVELLTLIHMYSVNYLYGTLRTPKINLHVNYY